MKLGLLLVGLAAASPLRRTQEVSQDTLDRMAFFAEYAGAAYCNSNATVGAVLNCSANVCPTATEHGATVAATLGSSTLLADLLTDMQGVVAVDPVAAVVVVAFMGSLSARNYLIDLDIALVDCAQHLSAAVLAEITASSSSSDCLVHDGFGVAWEAVRRKTLAIVAALTPSNYSLVLTGHSLGAAVATLAAAELRAQGIACDLYTYGSPRVGNEVLAAFVSSQTPVGRGSINNYRATHLDDPVPQLPPTLLGFRHSSPEFWLGAGTADDEGALVYTPADVDVCLGYDDAHCNGGSATLFDGSAHWYYFEKITGCQR